MEYITCMLNDQNKQSSNVNFENMDFKRGFIWLCILLSSATIVQVFTFCYKHTPVVKYISLQVYVQILRSVDIIFADKRQNANC